ncbi:MAG: TolC family protein [Bacteroidales bacterium]|nr:TolC family protein [Bacteroidales bacterium]
MGKIHYFSVVLFFFVPLILEAQKVMNLEECLQIGLENNYDLRIVRNEEQISDNNATLGNAGFLPTIGLNGGYNYRESNSNQFPRENEETLRSRGATTQMLDAGVNLTQPLFEGFKVQANYKRLNELKTIGELNTRLEVENFIADLTAEYFNYVQQNIRLNNLKYAVRLSEERLRIVEARYQIGSLSRLDLQQAKVDFNADSSLLIQQYEVLNVSRIKLNELMGIEDVEQPFITEDTIIRFNAGLSKEKLYEGMLSENILLKLVQKDKVLSELDLKMLQSQNYPYLKLNAEYGFTHYDYNAGTIEKQRNWGPAVGLTLGFTVFNGFNRKREQKNARIAIENRQLIIEKQKLSLQSNFANMWMAYQNNIELTKLEYESLENARINYEIAIDRYKLGDLSGLELREAQNSLLEAGQRLVNAQYRTKLCEISLMQISGKIEEYL